MSRPSWDEYFMMIARSVALRGTCDRKKVGAVLVRDHQILATGYNGAPSEWDSCDEVGHQMVTIKVDDTERQSCIRTIHAEVNAIAQCASRGIQLRNSAEWRVEELTLYTTVMTCYECAKLVTQAGVRRIVYGEVYDGARNGGLDVVALLQSHSIEVAHLELP